MAIQKLSRMSVPAAQKALLTLALNPALPVDLREQAALSLPRPLPAAIEQTVLAAIADSEPMDPTQAPLVTALRFASSQAGRLALLKLLQHPAPAVQDKAATSLGVRREAAALTPLLDLLQERRVVGLDIKPLIAALGQLGHSGATSTLSAILQDETLAHTWKAVITALAQIGDVRAVPALIVAGQQTAAENFGVWSALVSALATIGHPDGINFLLDQLSRDPNQAGQWLGVFRRIPHEEAITPLLGRGLTSPIAAVREKAIVGLGSSGTERIIPGLIASLRDPDEDVRLAAENGLSGYAGTIQDRATVELILAAVQDPTINHIWPLLDCLSHAQGNAATLAGERLVSRLETGEFADGDTLWRIVMLLGQLRASQAVKPLGDLLLTHPDPGIRRHAAQALGRIGTGGSARFLIRAFSNQPSDDIRQALTQVRYLCELIDHLPLTRDILTSLAVRYHLRIFADGQVTLPEGPPRPCREALQFL